MEEGIRILVGLIRTKKKIKGFNVIVPSKAFATMFIENAERELEMLGLSKNTKQLELNIFVETALDEGEEKDNEDDVA